MMRRSRGWQPARSCRGIGLAAICLVAGACTTTPTEQLRENFRSEYGSEAWYSAIDEIEVNGTATIVISTKLDPLDPHVEELGVEICEAMARTTPSEDSVSVYLNMLVPGSQQVDGSHEDPMVQETAFAETVSFEEDTCKAELYEAQLEAHQEALGQLDD